MRGLYILVEGQTEEEFVNEVLKDFFLENAILDVRAIKIQTSPGFKGGAVNYQRYKSNIKRILAREEDIIVTSLIDYYKLSIDFPNFKLQDKINGKPEKLDFLESEIYKDIDNSRFLPYIQLHEFEGLLFSHQKGFDYIPGISLKNRELLKEAVEEHNNPELLNDGEETAPSKRLKKLIPFYEKTFHGPLIAEEISIQIIKSKCIRFSFWLDKLIDTFHNSDKQIGKN